jgi:hypothetical protein
VQEIVNVFGNFIWVSLQHFEEIRTCSGFLGLFSKFLHCLLSEGLNFWLKKLTSTCQPSSLDLVPCDFFFFLKPTQDEKGKKIIDISTIQAALYAAFSTFETWIFLNIDLTTLKKLLSRGQH